MRMKTTGPIPAGYGVLEGELAIGGVTASALVAQAGDTPLFVSSPLHLQARVADLRAGVHPGFGVSFTVKCCHSRWHSFMR